MNFSSPGTASLRGCAPVANITDFTLYRLLEVSTTLHNPSDPNSISSNIANQIYESKDGTFWIATSNGLNKFDPAAVLTDWK